MRKIFLSATAVAVLTMGLVSCGGQKTSESEEIVITDMADNSQNSLDWKGTYSGVIPCADCEGIQTTITLSDSTYKIVTQYLGKGDGTLYTAEGKFVWDAAGSIITLENTDAPGLYQVGENKLIHLDIDGNVITGELADKYVLSKVAETQE